jgi:membrane protein required for colicin V production
MAWVDWVIIAVLIAATLGGIAQGFLRSICSLTGLVGGLLLAEWNYERVAAIFKPIVPVDAIDNVIGFLLIALLVMAIANVVGGIASKTIKSMGLGCLDKVGGAVLGLVQGALLVTLAIMVTVAFFPGQRWLADAKLPQRFTGALHLGMSMSPGELGDRLRNGVKQLENKSPEWMHPGNGKTD